MNKKLFATGAVALSLLTFVPATFAFGGFGGGSNQNEAVQTALENGDYSAFVATVAAQENSRLQNISEEDFAKMVERRAEAADRQAAAEEYRTAIAAAIEAGDYGEWVALVTEHNSDSPLLETITADNFDQFTEMHNLNTQARAIAEELGIGFGQGGFGLSEKMGGEMGEKMGGKRGGDFGGGRHFED